MGRVEEQLISEETAKFAKEKGFDGRTLAFYFQNFNAGPDFILVDYIGDGQFGEILHPEAHNVTDYVCKRYSAPTQAHLQKWLRDVHGIDIWVVPEWIDHTLSKVVYIGFYCGRMPWEEEEDPITEDDYFDTYEEALESTLKQALEFI